MQFWKKSLQKVEKTWFFWKNISEATKKTSKNGKIEKGGPHALKKYFRRSLRLVGTSSRKTPRFFQVSKYRRGSKMCKKKWKNNYFLKLIFEKLLEIHKRHSRKSWKNCSKKWQNRHIWRVLYCGEEKMGGNFNSAQRNERFSEWNISKKLFINLLQEFKMWNMKLV